MFKPKLFIGSSRESLDLAHAIQANLDHSINVTVWGQGVFRSTQNTMSELISATHSFDFAAFVFSADDIAQIRGEKYNIVRDNLIFEFGLFIGALGSKRVFFVIPRNAEDLHLPSDLSGIIPLSYDESREDDYKAMMGHASTEIKWAIEKELPAFHFSQNNISSIALAISLLPSGSIIKEVQTYLGCKSLEMPVKEIVFNGIYDPVRDLDLLKKRIFDFKSHCKQISVREVHLFIAGPVQAGTIVGAMLANWDKLVYLYHMPTKAGERLPEIYQSWGELAKI